MTTPAVTSPILARHLRSVSHPGPARRRGAELIGLIDAGSGARELAPMFAEHAVARSQLHAIAASPLLGSPRRSARLVDAIGVVGIDVARGIAVHWVCGALDGSRGSLPVDYWTHAVATASGAGAVADSLGRSRARAVSLGLVHDVGRVLLKRSDPSKYNRLVQDNDGEAELCRAEERTYGCDHALISAGVLRAFDTSDEVIDAVAHHHRPLETDSRPMTIALAAGDALASCVLAEGTTAADVEQTLVRVGLAYLDPELLTERIRADLEGSAEFLAVA